jgi:hypothetical protein
VTRVPKKEKETRIKIRKLEKTETATVLCSSSA